MEFSRTDTSWMELALEQAERAAALGEVPVGAGLGVTLKMPCSFS